MVLLSFSNDRGYVKTQIMRTFSPLFFYIVINYDIYSLFTDDIRYALTLLSKSENYKLYEGPDTKVNVRYVGIIKREPEIRFKEHLRSRTNRPSLDFFVKKENLSHINARIEEQKKINQYGLGKNGGVFFNLRNEIHPKYWIKLGIIK